MSRIKRLGAVRALLGVIAATAMTAGCSTTGAQGLVEVRVATRIQAGSPKLVVVGPARLLHVDVHGRELLNLYSVKRGPDGTVSCLDGVRTRVVSLRQRASNELNLLVAAGEAICVIDDALDDARNTDVSWHVRSAADAPVETIHASNL
jgi:hypothetical protein